VRVEVQLFATLVPFLPPDSRNGAATLDMPEGSTVRDVAGRLGIPGDFDRVSLVNGQAAEPESALHPGDVVTVFPPLMGGQPDPSPAPPPAALSDGAKATTPAP